MDEELGREGRVVKRVPQDTFAHRVMLARSEAGNLTIDEAAKRCGLGAQNWSNWEKGRIPRDILDVAEAIAEGLGIDEEWLLRGGPLTRPERRQRVIRGLTLSLGWTGPGRARSERRPRRLRTPRAAA